MKKKLTIKNILMVVIGIVIIYFVVSFTIVRGELRKYISPKNNVLEITIEDISGLEDEMTYLEILKTLGKTKDIGFTKPMAKYQVGDKYLYIGFVYIHDKSNVNAEGYINSLTYDNNK